MIRGGLLIGRSACTAVGGGCKDANNRLFDPELASGQTKGR